LSYEELKNADEKLTGQKLSIDDKWKTILIQCDLDGNGKIDFQEFLTAAIEYQKLVTDENIQMAFNAFDINKDGVIDIFELQEALPINSKDRKPEALQKHKPVSP
jgi:calcium-dependent protein kinase